MLFAKYSTHEKPDENNSRKYNIDKSLTFNRSISDVRSKICFSFVAILAKWPWRQVTASCLASSSFLVKPAKLCVGSLRRNFHLTALRLEQFQTHLITGQKINNYHQI